MPSRYKLLPKEQWIKLLKSVLLAASGPVLAFIAEQIIPALESANKESLVILASILTVLVNFIRKLINEWKDDRRDPYGTYPLGPWVLLLAVALPAVVLASPAAAQMANWNGRLYSGRVCSNPNCGMCAAIQSQIEQARQAMMAQANTGQSQAGYQTVTEYQTVTRQVKRCNGRRCWYETVTELMPVTKRVPIEVPKSVTAKVAPKPEPPDLQTVTELVPTPQPVVDAMLQALNPPPHAKLFDLGCGDGRILITAAKYYGCTTVGVELNPETARMARQAAEQEFVAPLVLVFTGDVRKFDLRSAQLVTMYLYPELMSEIVPRLQPGTRVASYQHEIPGVESIPHTVRVGGEQHVFYTGVKQ